MSNIFNPVIQNSLQLPTRRAWIEIYNPESENNEDKISFENVEGLNIKFDVQSFANHFPKAQISISNLNQEHIDRLLNFCKLAGAIEKKKVIRLNVGYNDSTVCIFEGYIFDTKLTSPPDIQFSFSAIIRGDALWKQADISLTNQVTIKQVYEEVAKKLGLQLDYKATSEKTLANFVSNKSVPMLLNDLKNLDNKIDFYLANAYQNNSMGVMRVYDKNEQQTPWSKNHILNAKTGLLGVPEFTVIGANIRCQLNPQITRLDTVEIESIYQKAGNGKYLVMQVQHIGELRGNNFETRIFARFLGNRMES